MLVSLIHRIKIFENLRALTGAPSVQMSDVPPSFLIREEDEDAQDPDVRTDADGKRQHDAEFYRDDKDQRGNVEDTGLNGNDAVATAAAAPAVVPMDVDVD